MQSDTDAMADLANRYGISHRTLRFYESIGLLAPRRIGNHRLYSSRDRIRLELIVKGKRLGFSLAEIRLLIRSGAELPHRGEPAPSQAERLEPPS